MVPNNLLLEDYMQEMSKVRDAIAGFCIKLGADPKNVYGKASNLADGVARKIDEDTYLRFCDEAATDLFEDETMLKKIKSN